MAGDWAPDKYKPNRFRTRKFPSSYCLSKCDEPFHPLDRNDPAELRNDKPVFLSSDASKSVRWTGNRVRPEVKAVFHTHSPWASGVISSGAAFKPMSAEFVAKLGRVTTIPYVTPTTIRLANAVEKAARDHETIFMINHGVLALGLGMNQAFYRCLLVEHSAISLVTASVVGKPRFLSAGQMAELTN